MHDSRHSGRANRHRQSPLHIPNFILLFLLLGLIGLTACGASSQGTNTQSATSAQIRISTPPPQATVGVSYNAVLSVSGGTPPYQFGIANGTLPPGLSLNPATGSITGTPTVGGTYNFVINVWADPKGTVKANFLGSISLPNTPTPPTREVNGSTLAQILVSANRTATTLSISPSTATITSQGQQQFTAQVSGTASTSVTWYASAGTISSTGTYVAPKVTSNTPVTITAAATTSPNLQASATVTVAPQTALAVTNSTLAEAYAGTPYTAVLSATGGATPYQWSIASGALPSGIQLQSSAGVIAGTTALSGSYPLTAKVTDAAGHTATAVLSLVVSSTNGFDGPAELPRVYIQTAMSNTPAPGTTMTVNSGRALPSALTRANCGDTVQLQAGATFTGIFTFPAKSCDDGHWIVVRSSTNNANLPAEGTRLTPCYAGISSLPGRPAFNCASTNNVLAKLVMAEVGSGPVVFASGANHYRLIGLEITRLGGTGVVSSLSSIASSGTASSIIFDRVWMHGTAQDETTRGIELGGSTYFSIVDSFFTDFHCISRTGSCTDAQAINGGLGNEPMGPYKIVDNFLEASGENILFGGGAATVTPADIEVSRNHMFKPLTWMPGQPGFIGGTDGNPFIAKNLFELKNAQRVLLDSNIMEDSWGGFSQVGFAILVTPKNPGGTSPCTVCQITDVTIRNNSISHVGAGLQIANGPSDNGALAFDGERYSIHDIIVDDIDGVKYTGPGEFAQISTGPGAAILQNVSVNHVTAFEPSTLFIIGDELATDPQMSNVSFTNSIVNAGIYPVWSTGSGGTANCAVHDSPLTTFSACFSSYTFSTDAIIAPSASYSESKWPAGNFFPTTVTAVQFVNYNGGNGGDYHLQPASPYKGLGTDGKDLGADVDAVNSAIAGVE
jgi:hypothetical protein